VKFILTNQDNTEIKGKIFSVGKAFENETKSVAVHADILNEKQILIPGMYVNALIYIGNNSVKALPVEAVVKADGREFIFVLEEETAGERHDEQAGHQHADGHEHADEAHGKSYHFQRVEVKTGASQLGYVQVTILQEIPETARIVLKGAYYIQSHLLKSEGGGGHAH
jgi:cobalt-zinc-cadmium efflux system membrane fusion protein